MKKRFLKAVQEEGFRSDREFFCFYVMQGYRLADIILHLEWMHKIWFSYHGLYRYSRKHYYEAKEKRKKIDDCNRVKRKGQRSASCKRAWLRRKNDKEVKLKCCAQRLGYRTFKEAVKNLRRKGLTEKQIAMTFGLSISTYRLRKIKYHI